jgi:hypothetical protein
MYQVIPKQDHTINSGMNAKTSILIKIFLFLVSLYILLSNLKNTNIIIISTMSHIPIGSSQDDLNLS